MKSSHHRQDLAPLTDWPGSVTLVPYSGIQILDFGLDLEAVTMKPMRFIERITREEADLVERVLIPLTGDPELDQGYEGEGVDGDDSYTIRPQVALDPFLGQWVPVPVLRLKNERGPGGEDRVDAGPSTWARLRVVSLDARDPETGHTHRVQLALDTMLMVRNADGSYLAPDRTDAEKSRDFRFVSDPAMMDWFLRRPEFDAEGRLYDPQAWVSDWLEEMLLARKRAERPGRRVTRESLPHQFEHWARYLCFLKLIDISVDFPRIHFANTVSGREAVTPVDVDLVLDIGNSRTCGILIERFAGETRTDLARSFPLEIRDLSRPEFLYSGLFESRVEFTEFQMGNERYASRSGRRGGFVWPSCVRMGPEAMHLVAMESGTETASGLSSPKRYLWDGEPLRQDWRFHAHDDPNNLPRSIRAAMRYVNEAGDVLDQIAYEENRRLRPKGKTSRLPAIRPRFSRSSLFCFMLAEIIAHAMVQVNSPASRLRRPQSELPRRLDRVILTLPTATSVQEQSIIRSRARGALSLVWSMMGLKQGESSIAYQPQLIVDLDEASCTQLVYLYSELIQKFDGRIDRFLRLKGRPRARSHQEAPSPSLRLACIDIGAGTTDLMITTYWGEANRVLHPQQTFREGFRVAGDELLERVISSIVLPAIRDEVARQGGHFIRERLLELFAGDIGGQDQQLVQKRRQFAGRILIPIAIDILHRCESAEEFEDLTVDLGSILAVDAADDPGPLSADPERPSAAPAGGAIRLNQSLLMYIEQPARDLGAGDFKLTDVMIRFSRSEVDAIAREVFQKSLSNMAEMADHLGADVILLTGRPSRLPAVRSIIEEHLVVPPNRLVSMHSYKTGRWYPFRDPVTQRIGDPKSTVAVGGMLIALADSRIPNFKVSSSAFQMRSTARYIGEMDSSGQIVDDRVIFSNVNLNARKNEADNQARIRMFAPVYLGSRQVPQDRWTTTPLYRIDYATASAQSRPGPLVLTLEREDFEDEDERVTSEGVLRREAMREAFSVTEIEDGEGEGMKLTEVVLRLQTLGLDDEYWVDTGLFRL